MGISMMRADAAILLGFAAVGVFGFGATARAQCAPAEKPKLTAPDAAKENYFGDAVAVDGRWAFVGSLANELGTGAVYAYEHDGHTWRQTQKLVASDASQGENFGSAIALQGNRALIGAHREAHWVEGEGAVYVFEHDGSQWVERAKLKSGDPDEEQHFGVSVVLDGERALIGAEYALNKNLDYTGAAYVFEHQGGVWVQTAKLLAALGQNRDYAGTSVALSGPRALVGAPGHDGGGFDAGATFAFEFDGSKWVETTPLSAPDSGQAHFGQAVSAEHDRVVITAAGIGYIFEHDTSQWVLQARLTVTDGLSRLLGRSASLHGSRVLLGAPSDQDRGREAGAAYLFEHDGHTWRERAKLLATDGYASDHFGYSAALGERWLICGAPEEDRPKLRDAGSAYLFDLDAHAATWSTYGQGWPGTLGIPSLTAESNPVLGTTVRLDLASSYGAATLGVVFMGRSKFSYPTAWDGTLLVTSYGQVPLMHLLRLDAGTTVVSIALPNDPLLQSKSLLLQVLEVDPGASKGVSFTPGLELVLGDCG